MMRTAITALLLPALAIGCSRNGGTGSPAIARSISAKPTSKVDARADEIRSGSYEDTYGDEGCTEGCEGHESGFAWAREHEINEQADCPSDHGASFEEGCQAFANAEQTAADEIEEDLETASTQ